jgi:diaminopimelate decarboxylase
VRLPDRVSYGNTIKKERDIARAHALGVSLFAVDSHEEVEKIARAAPGARVFCRVLTDGEGAEWPLSRKFGCVPQMAVDVLVARPPAGPGFARRVLPCRFADDQARCLGFGPW